MQSSQQTHKDNSTQATFMLPIHKSRTNTFISVGVLNVLLVHFKRILRAGCIKKLTSKTEIQSHLRSVCARTVTLRVLCTEHYSYYGSYDMPVLQLSVVVVMVVVVALVVVWCGGGGTSSGVVWWWWH